MLEEQWKDIEGFEGIYKVSTFGRIKSLRRICRANTCGKREVYEKILSACKSKNGYLTVVLCNKGKKRSLAVHRIVAKTFIKNFGNKKEVNHKDENKTNNRIDNLEWCDRVYNSTYGSSIEKSAIKKYKPVDIIEEKSGKVLKSFISIKSAAEETGISNKNISSACNKNRRSAGGYCWRFSKWR